MGKEEHDQERMIKAVHESLAMLGESTYDALAFQMKEKYDIDMEHVSLEDFELALRDLFGPAAEIIINSARQRLA
jgi:hypothetical protein